MTRADAIRQRGDELLTVKEYAHIAELHPDSVRRRIRQGQQPGVVRVGGQWRIDLAAALVAIRAAAAAAGH